VVIRRVADDSAFATIDIASASVTVAGATVTIDPASDLASLTGYYVQLAGGAIEDTSGNPFAGIADKTTWNFTSASRNSPTISPIGENNILEDGSTDAIPFTIGDDETPPENLIIGASSNNQTLIPDGNIVLAGTGANRTIKVTPAANASGATTITITVFNGASTTTESFQVVVQSINDSPVFIGQLGDLTLGTAFSKRVIGIGGFFTDIEDSSASLRLSVSSNNNVLVAANIVGSNLELQSTNTQSGSAIVTVTAMDSAGETASESFLVVVGNVATLFNDSFETGVFSPAWELSGDGAVQIRGGGIDGNKHAMLHSNAPESFRLSELTLTADVSDHSSVVLEYSSLFYALLSDPFDPLPSSFGNRQKGDGISISVDEATWHRIADLHNYRNEYMPLSAGISSALRELGLNDSGFVHIRFSYFSKWESGIAFASLDNIRLVGVVKPIVLERIGNKSVSEQSLLQFKANAINSESPNNTLSYRLDAGAPDGASVDSNTGVFTWTPNETHGPGAYQITVRVTDSSSPSLDDSETFEVMVNESSTAPVLAPIGNKAIDEGQLLTFVAQTNDADVPRNLLTYRLDAGAPIGASVDSSTGVFTWTPSETDGPGVFQITIRVAYNGSPTLDDFETFEVMVGDRSPWQNYMDPHDVNRDGFISPLDALLIINDLNVYGSRVLSNLPTNGSSFVDVDGNNIVSPIDALLVINLLNNGSRAGESEYQSYSIPSGFEPIHNPAQLAIEHRGLSRRPRALNTNEAGAPNALVVKNVDSLWQCYSHLRVAYEDSESNELEEIIQIISDDVALFASVQGE
jgi:hypothetical protein